MIWVYAVRPAHLPTLGASADGVDGAAVAQVTAGEVAALVSAHPDTAAVAPTRQAVLDHAAVVEAAHREGPVLPARFATTFASEDALAHALRARHDALAGGLAHVAGHVEYGVRLAAAEPAPAAGAAEPAPAVAAATAGATTGRGYLQRLAAEQRAVDVSAAATRAAVDAVDDAVGGHTTDRWQAPSPPAGLVAALAYLVPSSSAPAFESAVASLRCPSAVVTCTGPWPPYSFTPREGALLDER